VTASTPSRRAGFSLIELIVVISIIALLTLLIVPAFNSLGRASQLTTATGSILDELNLARQTALTRNRVVEVRFYSLPDAVDPALAFRALRTFISDESGDQLSPLGGLKALPVGSVILDDLKFSTLLSETTRPRKASEVEDLPNAPATPYKSIRFRPTGGVELSAFTSTNDNWFLTIKNERDPGYPDRPADNFATIQLDPVTGRARPLRP
jgi:uncharacterized protein (TIGR02596 family)